MLGMWLYHEHFGGWNLLFSIGPLLLILFIMRIYFLTLLQRVIEQMNFHNVNYNPVLHWLSIIPVVHYIFDFFIIVKFTKVLRAEFQERNREEKKVNQFFVFGLTYCILSVISLSHYMVYISIVAFLGLLAGFFCLISLADIKQILRVDNIKKQSHKENNLY